MGKLTSIQNFILITLFTGFILQSCKSDKKQNNETFNEIQIEETNRVIEIITEDMEFQMQDTILSGWNTFHYKNQSPQTHFFLIEKYPEGKTLKDAKAEVIPVFGEGMDLINNGDFDNAMAAFGKLPEWYSEVQFLGGSGLLSPKTVGKNTLKLEPGYYLMECYVKMPNGMFHTSMGMIRDFIVADENAETVEPEASIAITLSEETGIVVNDSITTGTHVFSVHFQDQKVHENFVGHDINLVKLDQGVNLEVLEKWIDWSHPKGLIEPAPEGFTFLGGVNDMPVGNTGYFEATLSPGSYALISEVPNSRKKGLLKTFEVY